jgi:hypothetical protein
LSRHLILFFKTTSPKPAETNALISTKEGHEISLSLVSQGKADRSEPVDYVLYCERPRSLLMTARLHLEAGGIALPNAQASVAVNSLGLLDLVQIAAEGLAPKSQYQVYLAQSSHAPFGNLEALAVLKTNPDGAGIVQALGPLKTLTRGGAGGSVGQSERYLVVTDMDDASQVVLRQSTASSAR